jgi:hypothetical protein
MVLNLLTFMSTQDRAFLGFCTKHANGGEFCINRVIQRGKFLALVMAAVDCNACIVMSPNSYSLRSYTSLHYACKIIVI